MTPVPSLSTALPRPYAELHAHSCFSLLDGASTPEALLDRAVELDMPALALTDHDGLYAAVRFFLAAKERAIHPVIGAELTLEDGSHLLLLAENRQGYANLCWLISRAQLSGEKGKARLPWSLLTDHTAGLIALTGCRQGVLIASLLRQDRPAALRVLSNLRELFGPDHLYVELQHHLHPDDDALIADLADLAHQARLPLVATNNVHYARREGHRLHDVLVAIRHNLPLSECRRFLRPNSEYYLKSASELSPLFAAYPQALANTLEVASRCQLDLNFRSEAIPPEATDPDCSPDARLEQLCLAALPKRYPHNAAAALEQLRHELEIIRQTQLAGYFLLVWDLVRFARERGILVRGRGSAANSIVAYLLGITGVDPLAHGLLFERFLSAEARVMPDIDLDFCARRREEVIQYLYQRYGESHVGMVCNYVTYRERSALRDVSKALGVSPSPSQGEGQGEGEFPSTLRPSSPTSPTHSLLSSLCQQILGLPRHLSIHVGGMCITRAPLDQVVPLERATMPGRVVIQWDKDNVEDAGLIKIDLLSLRTLSAIDECLQTIRRLHGRTIDLDALPLDDPAVYTDLCSADTIGAFQVESRAQQQALVQMRPRCFADLIVEVALIRPGPLQGNMVHPYFRRRNGLEPVSYPHPLLQPILAETLGIVVFQEQVIRIAMALARFSAGEADLLRRAMSRHRSPEEMARFRQRFLAGAAAQNVPEQVAAKVFDSLAGFASYGFCKSHAAAFAKTAYDTLWLRAHYPAEYYCALLNNQPMGFYAPRILIGDAGRHGVRVLPVHINQSELHCTVQQGAIRLGLVYVEGLGEIGAHRLVASRPAGGYRNLADLCRRSRLPRKLIENLILAGALSPWGQDKRRLLWELGNLHYQEDELSLSYFSDNVSLPPFTRAEELYYEYATTGVSTQGHLMEILRPRLANAQVVTSRDLAHIRPGQSVRIAGLVAVRQSPPTAKGFLFLTLDDEWGLMNVIVHPDLARSQHNLLFNCSALVIEGTLQNSHGQFNILAHQVWPLA